MGRRTKSPHAYRNIFTLARRGKLPLLLKDGTSVEFPIDWTKEATMIWRKYRGLAKPGIRKDL